MSIESSLATVLDQDERVVAAYLLRIRFEVRARNEYFDLVPILEEYRRPRP